MKPDAGFSPGTLVELHDGVRRLVAPNPGHMTGPGRTPTSSASVPCAVVDPDRISIPISMRLLGWADIQHIFVTHTHRDHSPAAARLAQRTGAMLLGPAGTPGRSPGPELSAGPGAQ